MCDTTGKMLRDAGSVHRLKETVPSISSYPTSPGGRHKAYLLTICGMTILSKHTLKIPLVSGY